MTSRERVRKAISHQQPARAPVDLGSTLVTSIQVGAYAHNIQATVPEKNMLALFEAAGSLR